LFLQRIADVQHDYLRDDASSAATWRALLGRAAARDVNASDLAAAQARLGLADRLIDLGEPAQALDILAPLLATKTIALYSARAAAHYTAARAHDRLAQRASAIDHYNEAIAAAPDDDPDRIRERARAEIRRNF
jgi:tetratricopeptide (TPR) repeat protein